MTPAARYATSLVRCSGCDAQVNPQVRWAYGHYEPVTSNNFVIHSRIPAGRCPICFAWLPEHGQ